MATKKVSRITAIAEIDKIAHVTNASVVKCTGKSWRQWTDLLEALGARHFTHKEIAAVLRRRYKLSIWWQHEVASGFEVHIGRKLHGRNAKGLFSMTVTKSLPWSQKIIWQHLQSSQGLAVWLQPLAELKLTPKAAFEVEGGIFGEVRTQRAPSRVRLLWQDGEWLKPTFLQILIVARGKDKSMLVFQHEGITTAQIKADLRTRWRKSIEDFGDFLRSSES